MNRRGFTRRPGRSLESDVLTLHLVLGAALSGRTTPAHVYRAARRAAQSARPVLSRREAQAAVDAVFGFYPSEDAR